MILNENETGAAQINEKHDTATADKHPGGGENRSVNVLKGIAVVFVIITHFDNIRRAKLFFPFWITMAVPMFMFISGFTNGGSLNSKGKMEMAYTAPVIFKKLARLIIPYAFVFIISEIFLHIKGGGYADVWALLSGFIRGGSGRGAYFFPLMIQFVFLFPIIFLMVKRYKWKGVIACGVVNFLFEAAQFGEKDYRIMILRYILIIAIGCYAALSEKMKKPLIWVGTGILGFLYIYGYYYKKIPFPYLNSWSGTNMFASLWIVPVMGWLCQKQRLRFLPLEVIGKASYHILWVQLLFYRFLAGHVYSLTKNTWLQLLLCLLICLSVGVLYYYVESRTREWLIKKWTMPTSCG